MRYLFIYVPTGVVGISPGQNDGHVQVVWVKAKLVQCVRVWMTEFEWSWGIELPENVSLQIRDYQKIWQSEVKVVTRESCGVSPCAVLCFDIRQNITGVRANFINLGAWVMVTEISVE